MSKGRSIGNGSNSQVKTHDEGNTKGLAEIALDATFALLGIKENHEKDFQPLRDLRDLNRHIDIAGAKVAGLVDPSQRTLSLERDLALKIELAERSDIDRKVALIEREANLNSRRLTKGVAEEAEQPRALQMGGFDQQGQGGAPALSQSPKPVFVGSTDLRTSDHRGQNEYQNQRHHPRNLAAITGQGNYVTDDDEERRRLHQQQQLLYEQQLEEKLLLEKKIQLKREIFERNSQLEELDRLGQNPPQPSNSGQHSLAYTLLGSGKEVVELSDFKSDSFRSRREILKNVIEGIGSPNDNKGLNIITIKKAAGSEGVMVDNIEMNEMIIGYDVNEKNREEMVYFSPASINNYRRQEDALYEAIINKIKDVASNSSRGNFSNNAVEFELQLHHFFKDIKTIDEVKKININVSPEKTAGNTQQEIGINKFFENGDTSNPKLEDLDKDKLKLIKTLAKQIAKDGFKNNINLDYKKGNLERDKKSKISHISVITPNQDGGSKRIDIKASGKFDCGMHHVSVHLENDIYVKFNFINNDGDYAFDKENIKYLERKKEGHLKEITDPTKLTKAIKLIKRYKIDITTNAEENSYTQIRQNNTLPSFSLRSGTKKPKIESRKKVESSELFQFETKDGNKCFSFSYTDHLSKYIDNGKKGVEVKIVKNQDGFELNFGEKNSILTKKGGWFYDKNINSVIDRNAEGEKIDVNVDLERKSQHSWGITKFFGRRLFSKEPDDHMVIRAYDKEDKKYYEFKIKKTQNPVFGLSKYKLECTSISDSPKTIGHKSGGGVNTGRGR